MPAIAAGIEQLSFRDARLDQLYGTPLGIGLQYAPVRRGTLDLVLRASLLSASGGPRQLASFVDQAEVSMRMIPVRLTARIHRSLHPSTQVWAGPLLAWAWFREAWEASVLAAGMQAGQEASGSWLGLGGAVGTRVGLGRWGSLDGWLEWVWCDAERQRVPGDQNRSSNMEGGWWGLGIAWATY
jgi:hypothetical protein